MIEIGYNLKTYQPKLTINVDDDGFDYAIRITCKNDCPFIIARYTKDWGIIIPSINDYEQYKKMRDEI